MFPSLPQEFMDIVQKLQEDNRRLHLMVSDMKKQSIVCTETRDQHFS